VLRRDELVVAQDQVLRKATLYVREARGAAQELHVSAEIAAAITTEGASQAGAAGIDGNPGPAREASDTLSDLQHDTGNLVPEGQRLPHGKVADRAAVEVVQIRPADAPEAHRHANFTRERRGVSDRLDPHVLLSVAHRS